ncbi:MAG: hypothetical protein JNK90_19470 [Planctomycetaceae bacterium]|jgi:hypothetical protein|nr:hypothetical protein [Planctomycetaceae bacterium]MBN8604413.1 hypothetical protein [Planctomycetota bacterium]
MAGVERDRELRRRRHRAKKLAILEKKAAKATKADKPVIIEKLRKLTPGANILIERWGLKA